MGRSFCVALALLAVSLSSSPSRAQAGDTNDKVRDANDIINTFRMPPVTRGLRSAKKERPPECDAAFESYQGGTRAPAKKDRDTVEECTNASVKLDFLIPFALNSADLAPSAQQQLEQIGKALESDTLKSVAFVIAGHTDRRGDRNYNLKLSQLRAEAVRHYLLENFAVGGRRLRAVGFGYEFPKMTADPYADINRRVELIRAE